MKTTRKPDFIPAIHDQGVKKHDIPNYCLAPKHAARFNGSIVDYQGKYIFAYRRYDPRSGLTSIAISHLDETFHPIVNFDCDLPPKCSICIQEDCRLFIFNEELWISYTELDKGLWDANRGRDIYQCHAKLEFDGTRYYTKASYRPRYGDNYNGVEKNWTYFEKDGDMYAVYHIGKGVFLKLNPDGEDAEELTTNQRIFYPYGYLRGGTPPVKIDTGEYLSFFHGSSEDPWLGRRYYMGAYTFDPNTFKVTRISKDPLVFGSKVEEFCGAGNGMCVFPMGSVLRDNQWHVSCGINDTYNSIITMSEEQVNNSLVASEKFDSPQVKYYLCRGRQVTYKTLAGMSNTWKMIAMSGTRGITGVLKTTDPFTVKDMEGKLGVTEISEEEYYYKVNPQKPQEKRENGYAFSNLTLDSSNGLSILR